MLANIWHATAGGFKIDTMTLIVLATIAGAALSVLFSIRHVLLSSRRPMQLRQIATRSNLKDEQDSKYDKAEDDHAKSTVRVKALCIHPIKSCRPIEVKRALLTKTGFAYDRCFSLALEKTPGDWKFLSQRTKPGMALIEQRLWLPHSDSDPYDEAVKTKGCLVVSFPDPDVNDMIDQFAACLDELSLSARPKVHFTIPLQPTAQQIDRWGLRIKTFTVQERNSSGLDFSAVPEVAAILPKLKKFLQVPDRENLTLMACTPDTLAPTDTNLAPLKDIGSPATQCYTDEQPLHIINLPSVHATSQLLPAENQPLSARRFRPNIFVTGAPAYSEEAWKRFRILPRAGSAKRQAQSVPSMSVVCRTARCTMPNVEPETGSISYENAPVDRKTGKPQPSTTMVEHRMVEDKSVNPIALGYMGVHCVPEDSTFGGSVDGKGKVFIEVGDEVEVFETGVHHWGSTASDY